MGDNLDWLNNLINTGADAYSKVKAADALSHQQLAQDGTVYVQGQFGTQGKAASLTISPTVLLLAGVALLVVFLKD